MKKTELHRLTRRASLLKLLAHPSRLLIIESLEAAPCCVGELTDIVGADISTVSKHLAAMKKAGLIGSIKQGNHNQYFIFCTCITHLVDCIEEGMNSSRQTSPRKKPYANDKQNT